MKTIHAIILALFLAALFIGLAHGPDLLTIIDQH